MQGMKIRFRHRANQILVSVNARPVGADEATVLVKLLFCAASPTRNWCTARTGTDWRRLGCGVFAVALTAFREVCARVGFIFSGGELA
jgi:hypothetical protein